MSHVANTGWYDPHNVSESANSLMQELGKLSHSSATARPSMRRVDHQRIALNRRMLIVVALVGLFFVAVMVLPSFLPGEALARPGVLNHVVRAIMVLVPLVLGVRLKNKLRTLASRGPQRDRAMDAVMYKSETLASCDLAELKGESVGAFPWLGTERELVVRCNLFGAHREHPLALLECEHSVKPGLKHTLAQTQEHPCVIQSRTAEAVVFMDPLPLPMDLFVAARGEPQVALFQRWLKRSGHRPNQYEVGPAAEHWIACSQAENAASWITAEMLELLQLRPGAILHVMAGYCVVFPRIWSVSAPTAMAASDYEVEMDLDFACAVYEALRRVAEQESRPALAATDGTGL